MLDTTNFQRRPVQRRDKISQNLGVLKWGPLQTGQQVFEVLNH